MPDSLPHRTPSLVQQSVRLPMCRKSLQYCISMASTRSRVPTPQVIRLDIDLVTAITSAPPPLVCHLQRNQHPEALTRQIQPKILPRLPPQRHSIARAGTEPLPWVARPHHEHLPAVTDPTDCTICLTRIRTRTRTKALPISRCHELSTTPNTICRRVSFSHHVPPTDATG